MCLGMKWRVYNKILFSVFFTESDNRQNLQELTDSNHNKTHRGHTTTTDYLIMDDVIETEVHSRSKRNAFSLGKTIREYTIEVLVAVDKKMQEKHRENLQEYVLTLMSTVSLKQISLCIFFITVFFLI